MKNYLTEMNCFYDWLETHRLSPSAILLWHALMHVDNKTHWMSRFTVASSVLESKTNLSSRTLSKARGELQEAQLLQWHPNGGGRAATYELLSVQEQLSDAPKVTTWEQEEEEYADGGAALIKRDETKLSIYRSCDDALLPASLSATLTRLLNDTTYLEMLGMNFQLAPLTKVTQQLKQFFKELAARGETHKSLKDAKFHFANWLKIELKKTPTYASNQSTYSSSLRQNAESIHWDAATDGSTTGVEALLDRIHIG